MIRTIKITAYLLFLVLVSLLGVEGVLQSSDTLYKRFRYHVYEPPMFKQSGEMPWKLKKNFEDIHIRRGEFSVTIRTNSQGLREDREITVPKPADTIRIITLGDSYAFGFGVERSRAFQAVLEDLLKGSVKGKKVEVIDMGYASSYSPDAAYIFLKERADYFDPDIVLHIFCYDNDIGNISQNFPYSDFDKNGLPEKVRYSPVIIDPDTGGRASRINWENERQWRFFPPQAITESKSSLRERLKATRLYDIVNRYIEIERMKAGRSGLLEENFVRIPKEPWPLNHFLVDGNDEPRPANNIPTAFETGSRVARTVFTGMLSLTKERGQKFGVVLVPNPVLVDYDPNKPDEDSKFSKFFRMDHVKQAYAINKPDRVFGGWFKSAGIPYLDPTLGMRENRTEDYYFEFDAHWNNAGHQRLAEVIRDWIVTTGWLTETDK